MTSLGFQIAQKNSAQIRFIVLHGSLKNTMTSYSTTEQSTPSYVLTVYDNVVLLDFQRNFFYVTFHQQYEDFPCSVTFWGFQLNVLLAVCTWHYGTRILTG